MKSLLRLVFTLALVGFVVTTGVIVGLHRHRAAPTNFGFNEVIFFADKADLPELVGRTGYFHGTCTSAPVKMNRENDEHPFFTAAVDGVTCGLWKKPNWEEGDAVIVKGTVKKAESGDIFLTDCE